MGIKDLGDEQKKKLKELPLDRTLVGTFNDAGTSHVGERVGQASGWLAGRPGD